ncbi:flavin-containing monooxygenase [Streptomyces achromogenes]|uniref:flavin-containing monooxygenase n=1 Tax=Streptomyces achromogenes TaxID=67255 RepID=UPI0036CFE348
MTASHPADVPRPPVPADPPVYVIGAGPGGLAVAQALRERGVRAVVLEKSDRVGASWRGHYDRLRLHTTRRLSALPGLPMPRRFGRWVSRDNVVRYLEKYAEHHRLELVTGVEVHRVERTSDGTGWLLRASGGRELTGSAVVVATGFNHTPRLPDWPGGTEFGGEWPAQYTGVLVRRLPVWLVDRLAGPVGRLSTPDLSAHGLPRPDTGLYSRVKQGAIPVQDVGLVRAVRTGGVEVVAAVEAFDGDTVVLADGSRITPDAVIAATGYVHALEGLVGHLGVLDGRGRPVVHGGRTSPKAPGLYFTGFTNPISGMLRELAIDAERIARAVGKSAGATRAKSVAKPAVKPVVKPLAKAVLRPAVKPLTKAVLKPAAKKPE